MLIPIAIAINIILGQTVAAALKVPIYLDSIGTILVGVLAGPMAGALTGGLANLIWTYVLPAPFHSDFAAPFFIVAVEIGLLAGVFGRFGFFRSRPNAIRRARSASAPRSTAAIILVIAFYGFIPFYTSDKGLQLTFFARPERAGAGRDLRHPRLARGRCCSSARARRADRLPVRAARPRGGLRLRGRPG